VQLLDRGAECGGGEGGGEKDEDGDVVTGLTGDCFSIFEDTSAGWEVGLADSSEDFGVGWIVS